MGKIKTWVTTGNAPVKVGVLVSLIGVGLLLREAGRRDLINVTIEMRLAAVALFGLALLAIGWRLRLKNPVYGLSLQGGAVAVLYLTTYASFGEYEVLGAAPAAVAVIAVTVGAGVLAVRQDSRPLAVLGIIGGFLAPVLTYSQPEDHVTLLGFYAVLSAAILAVAWYKTWPELNLLGLGFTFAIAAFWLSRRFDEDDWSSVQPLIAVLILLYLAIPVLFAIREAPELRRAWTATLVFATPFMGFGVQYLAVGHTSHGSELSALALALVHGALWVAARRLGRECRQLAEAYAGIAVTFSVIAVPLAFDSYFTATVWAAQGCLLVWAGCRRQQILTVVAGSLLQVLAAASFGYHLLEALPYSPDTAVIANGFLTGAAMLAVAGMASGWLMHGARERLSIDPSVPWIALIWGVGWWISGGLMEIGFQMSAQRLSAALVFVVVSFGAAAGVSNRARWPHLNALGVLVLPTLWVVALTSLAIQSHPLDLYGWAAWPLSIVVFYWFLRFRESLFPRLVTTLHAGAYWLVALLVGVEAYWQVDQAASGVWLIVAPAAAATAAAAILLGGRWLRWPLQAHRRDYIRACAGPTVLLAGIAVTGTALVSAGDPSPLPYLPLLNPLDVLAAAVVGIAYLLSRQAAAEPSLDFTDRNRAEWAWPLVAVGTALATMDVARTIHHWLDVPWHVPSMLDSTAFQTSLSIVWTLIAAAAMVAGARTGKRSTWVVGASWAAVVIVKLLLVDLAEPSTPGRATSFIGAGLLLLMVGYMAPTAPAGGGPGASPSLDPMTKLTGKLAQWVTAANSPAKAGVVLALIGSGLLVTEAAAGGVSVTTIKVRLVAVAASALLLLTFGWLQRRRRPTFALSLQGGAIAVLHVAAYAAFGVHDLVPAALVMAMIVVITAGAGVLCVAQDSRVLAVLGIVGGFLAPVLTHTSPDDHVVVLGFFVILSAGIVAVARFKVWPELNLLGLALTFAITAYWLWDRFDESGWAAVQPLVAVLVLLYLAIPVVFAQRGAPDISKLWMQPLVLGTPFMGFGLQYLAVGHLEYGLAVSALALAAVCGTLAAATHRLGERCRELTATQAFGAVSETADFPQGERCRELTATYAGLGALFSAIAVPFALGADFTATVWAAQGALLVWIGCRRGRLLAVAGGALLQLLAGCVVMVRWGESLPYPADTAVLRNEYVLAAAVLAVSGLVSGWRMHANRGRAGIHAIHNATAAAAGVTASTAREPAGIRSIHASAPWLALLWGTGWWLAGGLTEIANQVSDAWLSASLAFVVVSFGGAVAAAGRLRWPHLNTLGLLILPTMAAGLCVSLITQGHPLEHLGWAAWPAAMAVFYACLRLRENELAPVANALSWSGPHSGAGDDTARASAASGPTASPTHDGAGDDTARASAASTSGPTASPTHDGAGDGTARASARVAAVLHAGGFWLLAVLVGVEVGWRVDQAATGVWPVLAVLGAELVLAGGVLWGGRWLRWPLGVHRRCYLLACAGPTLALLAAAALVAGIASNGDPEPLVFLPVLNPLALTIAAVVAVGLAWRAFALSEAEHPLTSLARASWTPALAVASTVLITTETARTVHHWQGVPWELEALASSAALQTALSVIWAAQGALLVWIGCRRGRLFAVAGGGLLQLLAGCVVIVRWGETLPYPAGVRVIANEYILAAAVVAVSGLVSGWRMHTARGPAGIHASAPWLALLWGTGWWLASGLTEIANQVSDAWLSASLAFVVVSFGGAVAAAGRLRWPHLNTLGLLILPTMAAGLCVSLITQGHPLEHLGWAAWPVSMAVFYACLRLRENELAPVANALSWSGPHSGAGDDTARASARVAAVLHAGGFWLLAVLVGVEVGWQVDQAATGVWPVLAVLGAELVLAGGVLWGGRWLRWPLGVHRRCYLLACAGPTLALLAAAALVAGIASNGDPEPLVFLPVLNPLALTIAAVVAVGLAWRAFALSEAEHPLTSLARASWTPALAVASTVLITTETARTVHHWQGVPWELEALASSAALQTALSVIWAAQGALLVWIGCRRGRLFAVAGGGLLQLLAGCVVIVRWGETLPYPAGVRVIANEYILAAAVVAVSGLVSGWRMHTARGPAGIHASAPWLALLWGTGWWLASGLTEIANQVSDAWLSASLAFVVVSFGGAVAAAGRLRWPHLNTLGLLILPTMAAGLCVSLITQGHPLEHLGWAAWPVSMAVFYACLRLRENELAPVANALSWSGPHSGAGDDTARASAASTSSPTAWPTHSGAGDGTARASARVAAVLHAGGFWLLAVLVGVEVGWQVDQVASGVWPPAAALGAVLVLVGATLAGRRLAWPLGAHWRSYVAMCTGPMLIALAVAVLMLAVISDGDPSPLPFVPVLNPLGVLLGLHLAVTLAWRRLAEAEWHHPFPELIERRWMLGLAVAGTVVATLETARTVSHWRGIAWDVEALAASTELQTSLSILWAVIGLSGMVAGVRLARRPVWVAGASFMTVVVAKLFLVDLSSLRAVGRMVSFIVVGVLLLIVGYLAPVPPAEPDESEEDPDPPEHDRGGLGVGHPAAPDGLEEDPDPPGAESSPK